MRNTLLAIALSAAGFATLPAVSHAADQNGGFFVNGNVGQATLNKGLYDDNDTGYGVNVGYRWALSPAVAIGVEGGYVDLGTYKPTLPSSVLSPAGGIRDGELKGWTAGVNGHFNVGDNWYISGRGGAFRADARGAYLDASSAPVNVDNTSTKWYAGAGFGYDFSNNLSVGLNYDYYKSNTNGLDITPHLISVSAEARF